MLQITKNLQTALFVPVDYINDNAGNLSRGVMAWDTGDNVLITLISGKNALGYNATTSDKGVKFVLNGDEVAGVYKVVLTLDRGARAFSCVVDYLVITDKVTTVRDTFSGVYFYAQNSVLQFAQAYTDSDTPATTGDINALREQISRNGGGGVTNLCVNATYAELKALRDGGQLVAGLSYRITDYTTITTQEYTAAAGHDFDIIVTATSANTLSEDARAALHEGDQYFKDCNLAAWRLRYALDMDGARFGWVTTPACITLEFEGTIDTLFRAPNTDIDGKFAWVSELDPEPLFTLSPTPSQGDILYDSFGDDIGIPVNSYTPGQAPTDGKGVVYHMEDEHGNAAPYDFKNIMFGEEGARALTFSGMDNGTLFDATVVNKGDFCKGNRIAPRYTGGVQFLRAVYISSVVGEGFPSEFNTVGANCDSVYIINGKHNVIGAECSEITLQNGCNYNTIGDNCNGFSFGTECNGNAFGRECLAITLGNNVCYNTFGNNCSGVTAGNGNERIVFADGCNNISLGAQNTRIYLGAGVGDVNFDPSRKFANITVMAGVEHIGFTCNGTASGICQNVLVNSGVCGTRTQRTSLEVPRADAAYLTTFGVSLDAKINV